MPQPRELMYVRLAERFGKWPWELLDVDADVALYWIGVMSAEAKAAGMLAGLPADEEFYFEGEF